MTSTATADGGVRRLTTPAQLRLASERWRSAGLTVGMVPTMGALHEGHRSLIRRARGDCDRVVVSIFVNPSQFGPGEDFDRYPRTLPEDIAMLEAEGVDAAYLPEAATVYPPGFAVRVGVEGPLASALEGAARPGHFDGVALVVAKLLIAARCDRAYFGDKDAQQCAVVRRLVADLDIGTEVVVCPIVRDRDGLALSSRNAYLSAADRRHALAIPAALGAALAAFAAGERSARRLEAVARSRLEEERPALDPEYVSVVDPETFETVDDAAAGSRLLVAARMHRARLIDTARLGVDQPPANSPAQAAVESEALPGEAERRRTCVVPS